jgi:hypothetical protein
MAESTISTVARQSATEEGGDLSRTGNPIQHKASLKVGNRGLPVDVEENPSELEGEPDAV